MKKIMVMIVMFFVCFGCLSVSAYADWSWSGAEDTNASDGDGYVDQIGLWWVSGDKFASPMFTHNGGNNLNWANINISDTNAFFWGPETMNNIFYTLNFVGANNTSKVLYQTSVDGVVRGRWEVNFSNGGGLNFSSVSDAYWEQNGGGAPLTTPEPVSSALFLLGGGALALARRKR